MMVERGIDMMHITIMRWVQRYVPEFAKHWRRYAQSVGTSWRVAETYIKVRGKWAYLYHCVDNKGHTVDFLLSEQRDMAAAKRFFQQVIKKHGVPEKVTLDGYTASHRAVAKCQEENLLPANLLVRTNRYVNNMIEQDQRRIKQRVETQGGWERTIAPTCWICGNHTK